MLVENEKTLARLIKKYRSSEKNINTENIEELIICCISEILHLIPNPTKSNPLSMMEMLCLIFIFAGKESKECAKVLNISEKSIKTYEQRARHKLKVKNRTNAFYVSLVKRYILLRE